ncbi:helix-turn-helix transcriptional regulator [Treponema socranskii]|uniref:helix-turn-helix domain-containing protein n=1 Tax=Treponema socranskii TaxID=53419 RepID=UPI003D900BD7
MGSIGCDIVDRIDELLKQRNLKRQVLADAVKFNVANIAHWKNRGNVPAADTALKIAQFFGTSVEWLITGKDPDGISDNDKKLLFDFHTISREGQEAVRTLLNGYVKKAEEEKKLRHG